jgi:hypothetical protein
MKNIKSRIYCFTIAFCIALFMSSCLTTRTNVGAYRETQGSTYTYAKGKQFWLFWGFMPLGRTNVSTPTNGSCQISTKFNLIDVIISGITGGIVITETIKVEAKK